MLPVLLTDTVTSDLDRALHYTLLWGLEGVVLRTVGGPEDRVPHVNEEKLRRRLHEHELPAVAVSPGVFEGPASDRVSWLNEVTTLDDVFRFCKRIDCPRVLVSAFAAEEDGPADGSVDLAADALRRAGQAAQRRGLEVAVMNEVDGAHPTGAALARLLGAVDHPAVTAAWDPAAAAAVGEDPADGLAALAGRVAYVRCAGLAGEAVDWAAQLRALKGQGYEGPLVLAVTEEPRAQRGLRDATRMIQLMRGA